MSANDVGDCKRGVKRADFVTPAKMFPGVPQVRTMVAGGTDAAFLTPVGIPTYGISGYFFEPANSGVHGLNERVGVADLYRARDYLYELMKIYANQPG